MNNKVLVVELNAWHGECLPGYIKYFKDLGYEVEVLINEKQRAENPLCMFKDISVIYENSQNIIKYLSSTSMQKYDLCLFNSDIIYEYGSASIIDLIKPQIQYPKILCVEHHLEYIPFLSQKAVPVVLKKFNNSKSVFEVNPHYFGEYPQHHKSKITNFIVVGSIEGNRKNYGLLISAVNQLLNEKISDFRITVIGKGNLSDIPENIRSYFDIKGRLSYSAMYQEMNKADYFLTLLDSENPKHNRYLKYGTSGSFQLIYGFQMPCLIAEKFAEVHSFNDKNSIIYKDNSHLYEAMLTAVKQDDVSYQEMKKKLKKISDTIYQTSLENLQCAIYAKVRKSVFTAYSLFLYYVIANRLLEIKKKQNPNYEKQIYIKTEDKKSLKYFLYHQVKTHNSIKTYICGIKVKRRKIKIDEHNVQSVSENIVGENTPKRQNSFMDKVKSLLAYPMHAKDKYDRLRAEIKYQKMCN